MRRALCVITLFFTGGCADGCADPPPPVPHPTERATTTQPTPQPDSQPADTPPTQPDDCEPGPCKSARDLPDMDPILDPPLEQPPETSDCGTLGEWFLEQIGGLNCAAMASHLSSFRSSCKRQWRVLKQSYERACTSCTPFNVTLGGPPQTQEIPIREKHCISIRANLRTQYGSDGKWYNSPTHLAVYVPDGYKVRAAGDVYFEKRHVTVNGLYPFILRYQNIQRIPVLELPEVQIREISQPPDWAPVGQRVKVVRVRVGAFVILQGL